MPRVELERFSFVEMRCHNGLSLVPPTLRGRVAAVVRVVSWGVGSFGALLGGILAEWSDLRTTMIVGAVGTLVAFIWLVLSPVRRVQ